MCAALHSSETPAVLNQHSLEVVKVGLLLRVGALTRQDDAAVLLGLLHDVPQKLPGSRVQTCAGLVHVNHLMK